MIKKLNPLYWLTKAMDTTDEWVRRMSYRGEHWVAA